MKAILIIITAVMLLGSCEKDDAIAPKVFINTISEAPYTVFVTIGSYSYNLSNNSPQVELQFVNQGEPIRATVTTGRVTVHAAGGIEGKSQHVTLKQGQHHIFYTQY